jgi:hypothetical protein
MSIAATLIAASLWQSPPMASPDGAEVMDVRQPAVVAVLLVEAGMRADRLENRVGDPFVGSNANGKPFSIQFYDCTEDRDCRSIQFYTWYKREAHFTAELANEWNAQKRFLRAGVDGEGDLAIYLDIAAEGGMTRANFRDTLGWFVVMEAEFRKFLAEKRPPAP